MAISIRESLCPCNCGERDCYMNLRARHEALLDALEDYLTLFTPDFVENEDLGSDRKIFARNKARAAIRAARGEV